MRERAAANGAVADFFFFQMPRVKKKLCRHKAKYQPVVPQVTCWSRVSSQEVTQPVCTQTSSYKALRLNSVQFSIQFTFFSFFFLSACAHTNNRVLVSFNTNSLFVASGVTGGMRVHSAAGFSLKVKASLSPHCRVTASNCCHNDNWKVKQFAWFLLLQFFFPPIN